MAAPRQRRREIGTEVRSLASTRGARSGEHPSRQADWRSDLPDGIQAPVHGGGLWRSRRRPRVVQFPYITICVPRRRRAIRHIREATSRLGRAAVLQPPHRRCDPSRRRRAACWEPLSDSSPVHLNYRAFFSAPRTCLIIRRIASERGGRSSCFAAHESIAARNSGESLIAVQGRAEKRNVIWFASAGAKRK